MKTSDQQPQLVLLTSPDWKDYQLLDSGDGKRLEQFGPYILLRPDPEAVWAPALPARAWENVHARFIPAPEENGGHWEWRSIRSRPLAHGI